MSHSVVERAAIGSCRAMQLSTSDVTTSTATSNESSS